MTPSRAHRSDRSARQHRPLGMRRHLAERSGAGEDGAWSGRGLLEGDFVTERRGMQRALRKAFAQVTGAELRGRKVLVDGDRALSVSTEAMARSCLAAMSDVAPAKLTIETIATQWGRQNERPGACETRAASHYQR